MYIQPYLVRKNFYGKMQKLSADDIHEILDHFDRGKLQVMDQQSSAPEDAVNFTDPLMVHFQSNQQDSLKDATDENEEVVDGLDDGCSELDKSQTNFLQNCWHELFDVEDYFPMIKEKAIRGRLCNSPYRGVCWKIFWECLPEEREEWTLVTRKLRSKYEVIRDKHLTDPYQSSGMDLAVNNPLSQEIDSPWHQYFQDGELRNTIYRDLERLYPEIEFFRKKEIDDMLLRCLFVYAKEHPHIVYKQGMHELIAPIVYVLWENAQNVKDSKEDLQDVIRTVNDLSYVEHDAFWLFSELMDSTEPMFVNHRSIAENENDGRQKQVADVDNLFVATTSNQPTSAIAKKLTRIQNYMLKRYDHELYSRLQELDIAPQLYGIRWIRLLFGREYPLPSLLCLWDAMFAEGRTLDLADFIFIAMLIHIRSFLLKNEYSACLMQLMKYPASTDAKMILRKALSLRTSKPSHHAKRPVKAHTKRINDRNASLRRALSESLTEEQKFAHVLGSGRQHVTKSVGQTSKVSTKPSQWYAETDYTDQPNLATTVSVKKEVFVQEIKRPLKVDDTGNSEASENRKIDRPMRGTPTKPNMVSQISSVIGRHTAGLSNEVLSKFSTRSKNKPKDSIISQLEEDHERLQRQISQLQSEFDRMQSLCLFCAGKMDSYLGFIEANVDDAATGTEVKRSCVAGLKKVRDILARTTELEASSDSYERQFSSIDKNLSAAFSELQRDDKINEKKNADDSVLNPLVPKDDHFGEQGSANLIKNGQMTKEASSVSSTPCPISGGFEDQDGLDYAGYAGSNERVCDDILSSNNSDSNFSESKSNSSTPSSPTPEPWGYLKPVESPGDFEKELLSIKDRYTGNVVADVDDEPGTALEFVALHGNSLSSQTGAVDEANDSLDPLSALEQHFT